MQLFFMFRRDLHVRLPGDVNRMLLWRNMQLFAMHLQKQLMKKMGATELTANAGAPTRTTTR